MGAAPPLGLRAFAQGGKPVEDIPLLTPQARKDYAQSPAPELAGIRGITDIAGQDVATQGIQRHGATVGRVLYYRLLSDAGARYVLVYLTAEGLVTDQDMVND